MAETKEKTTGKSRKKTTRKKNRRDGKLVIVESPAKAKTVGKFLGKGYTVKASVGHVRDLLRSRLSVDVENDFRPEYRVPREKSKVVKELKAAVKKASEVYLATDPDREGEAIAWHVMEVTEAEPERTHRVVFHEITSSAIQEAFSHPRDLDMNLVNAQQARRVLDRLVGYKISPLLWKRVRNRTSAGRVQSVALRLIVEREREIENFVPEEYWTIEADLAKAAERQNPDRVVFRAKLLKIDGKKADLKNESDTRAIVEELEKASYQVDKVKEGTRKRRPSPPFTTSTMQQAASRFLGFTASRTMGLAQSLYEGVDLGSGERVGLITYMRTDSYNVSKMAQEEARKYITENIGKEYLPEKPPFYRTKAKGAQEAHEAIRPTSVMRTPQSVKQFLTGPQYKLYSLIWRRFVASQMLPAVYKTISVDILAGPDGAQKKPYLFRATGSELIFAGFLKVYAEGAEKDESLAVKIPPLTAGELLDLVKLLPEQHFTQPPPRYTDASLVKALEANGIGRPSTYASIISTLINREYVERLQRQLKPTKLGFVVSDLLVKHFPDLFNVNFTSQMEEKLDRVASGEQDWVELLKEFYPPFAEELAKAEKEMENVKPELEVTDEKCPVCGAPLVVKYGRYGKFLACSRYPECKFTKPYLEKTGAKCPKCGGDLVVRRTRKGRIFYGCSNYPECDFTTWKRPLATPCPKCGGLLVEWNKKTAKCLQCGETFPLEEVEKKE